MIIGVGVDLIDIRRIERLIDRFGNQFTERVFTPGERQYAHSNPNPVKVYANRFAAKEAATKALGTGLRGGIGWQDIEVKRTDSGAPVLALHNLALKKLISLLPKGYEPSFHISFSDEEPYSIAFVIISCCPKGLNPLRDGE
jgi:holo-[acyl-carrier protein] synthase